MLDSEEDLDLLFISYDAGKQSLDDMVKLIKEHGFEAEVVAKP